ncbi:hypothetical protein NQ315_009510 [Exocentrus adspersus]|uniref:Uncharacterized protein n=1 Tax=Exocentrus adspersus TaxID=1586481 RepID=A0AAV8WHP3_9CUCU|nr:hypothetical protein NQ315_009510 [Exocentrus adspersus]
MANAPRILNMEFSNFGLAEVTNKVLSNLNGFIDSLTSCPQMKYTNCYYTGPALNSPHSPQSEAVVNAFIQKNEHCTKFIANQYHNLSSVEKLQFNIDHFFVLVESVEEVTTAAVDLTKNRYWTSESYSHFVLTEIIEDVSFLPSVLSYIWSRNIVNFILDKVSNFHKNPLRAAFHSYPGKIYKKNGKWTGSDYETYILLAEMLNASVQTLPCPDAKTTAEKLYSNEADIYIAKVFQVDEVENLTFTYSCGMDDRVVMLPKPSKIPAYQHVFYIFQPPTWIALSLTIILLQILYFIISYASKLNLDYASLSSSFVTPKYKKSIKTIVELKENGIKIYASRYLAENFIPKSFGLGNSYVFVNFLQTIQLLESINTSGAIVSSRILAEYYINMNKKWHGDAIYYIMKEALTPGNSAYLVQKASPFLKAINKRLQLIQEHALLRESSYSSVAPSVKSILNLSHFQVMFYILFLGYLAGFVVFLLERPKKEQLPKVTLQQVIDTSDAFPIKFPIDSVRCKSLAKKTAGETLEENINSAYPVLHEQALLLYSKFLIHKRKFGSILEKKLYQDMTLDMLVDRLLLKRAVSFVGRHDTFRLLTGEDDLTGRWELIGSSKEAQPLILKNCLSYDEIKLSALLSVSSYTQCINLGNRRNCGVVEPDTKIIEERGVIVGLIGTRLTKPGVMEYQEVVVTQEQNIPKNGYKNISEPTTKNLFLSFYGEANSTYYQFKNQFGTEKFTNIRLDAYFNNMVYERRLALSIDTFLIEANERAKLAGTMAYLHVVGIGLGVWSISTHQNKLFMDTCARRIEFLSKTLEYVSAICFSYIKEPSCGKYKTGDVVTSENHRNGGITILICDRNPHEKLTGPYEGHLSVVSYAWDGNALPGNEFWWGHLESSSDPAAASSTQVSELHNAHINPGVCAANLRVATVNGLLTLEEYQRRVPHDEDDEDLVETKRCLIS